jgi:hypothetical protein
MGEKPKNGKRNRTFSSLVNNKKAHVFETKRIITADNILLNPIRLELGKLNSQNRQTYLPKIHSVQYSPEYLTLLHDVATYSGVDPNQFCPLNILKVQNSLEKYLR